MSDWPSMKARRVLAALKRIGQTVKREVISDVVLSRSDWPGTMLAFHDGEGIGSRMLARLAKRTGLRPEDLSHGRGMV